MAIVAQYLLDTSAAARMSNDVVYSQVDTLIERGLVATAAPLDWEALYSARSRKEYEQLREDRRITQGAGFTNRKLAPLGTKGCQ